MNDFQIWQHFQKPDFDFLNLLFEKRNIRSEIKILDERRKNIQKEILTLSSSNEVCRTCPRSCCKGNYNHFTLVDYLLRMFSDNPINEFDDIKTKQNLYRSILI